MNEDERISIDLGKWFPEAARRVEVLEELKRNWASVVGRPAARWSMPSVLGVKELTVDVWNPMAKSQIINMKGNIASALSLRWGYGVGEDFSLKVYLNGAGKKK
ncbi:MAG: DUF721 domain-containing protein [Synergistaceae bacterium]|nr:DUF721 domain-containing protein [Synergistaceae bacterium]